MDERDSNDLVDLVNRLREKNRELRSALEGTECGRAMLRQSEEFSRLLEVSKHIVSELDLEKVFDLVASNAREIVNAELVSVPMLNAARDHYTYMAASGVDADDVRGTAFSSKIGMCGWVLMNGRSLLFGETNTYWMEKQTKWEEGQQSAMLVPLFGKKCIIGGLSALGKQGGGCFSQHDLELLTMFANQVSIAIENAQLFRQVALESEERKRAEEGLREKSDELDRYFMSSLDLLCIADTDGYFHRLNYEWEKTLGYTIADLQGRQFLELVHKDDVEKTLETISRLREQKTVLNFTNRYRCKDGSYRWIEWRSFPAGKTIYAAARDITEHKHAEDALRESEKRLSEIIGFLPDATLAVDKDRRIIAWNRAIEEMTGFRAEAMLGKGDYEYGIAFYGARRPMLIDCAFGSDEATEEKYTHVKKQGGVIEAETALSLRGRQRVIWGKVARLYDSSGTTSGAIEIMRDITEQREAEREQARLREQLFQSQKMETVGLLAGGVAHDFNNLLIPIIGYSEIMLLDLPEGDPHCRELENVRHAADLMKSLTGRLLAFSRKQVLDLKVINLSDIIRGFEQMAHRTIRENIEIRTFIEPSLGMVNADKGQMEQVLLNLAVNAQDAMPEGGLLLIEAKNCDLDQSYASSHPEVLPGPYVMLSVSDTGRGIDPDIQARIFEPFFTTKAVGKGTGLGLPMVYGIVKQHSGSISVYSERNRGATFKIFLPKAARYEKKAEEPTSLQNEAQRGNETVLVVEDNEFVRTFTCGALKNLGYNVLMAESADQSIRIAGSYGGTIDLLLTDVIMPKKNGKEIYDLLIRGRPGMKVLYISGYTADVIGHHGILDEGINFLQKPFTIKALSQKVRSVIAS